MAAQDEAAVEVEQEVLADCFHPLEPTAVEPPGEPLPRGARMRRLDLDALADQNLQPTGRAMERISFRHAVKPTIEACFGLLSASAGGWGSRSRSSPRPRRRSSSRSSPTARRTRSAITARTSPSRTRAMAPG